MLKMVLIFTYRDSCHGYKRRILDSTQYTKIPTILVKWVQMGKKWIQKWADVSLYFYALHRDGQNRYYITMFYMQNQMCTRLAQKLLINVTVSNKR